MVRGTTRMPAREPGAKLVRSSADSAKRFLDAFRARVGHTPIDAALRRVDHRPTNLNRIITDADVEVIIGMHRNGSTVRHIGTTLGIWDHRVARLLMLYGEAPVHAPR